MIGGIVFVAPMADLLPFPHSDNPRETNLVSRLGRREREVMQAVWELGQANVQQVSERLSAGLAYTTVMTTLDRLFRKGLLCRQKRQRAFIYSAALTAEDMEGQRAADMVRRFFGETDAQPEMLLSCLVNAVHGYDTELLDQLETRIRRAKAQKRTEKERGR